MIFFAVRKTPNTQTPEYYNTIKSLGGNMYSMLGNMYIDVNGEKGPNTLGRDVFVFDLSDEGKLYPRNGKDYALFTSQTSLDNNGYYWRNIKNSCENPEGTATISSAGEGSGCAGRIIENGWKMDY